ncbi:DnaD domain protein [Metabacillus fastidiosus]|uniref:DnaD domain protein n=1 Tax=Metabacillus fastidiosus TaxID=1458 RepID=UPI003D2CFBC4
MNKDQFIMMQESGSILVPTALLSYYSKLGLNEEELILLIQVIKYKQQGNHFPTPNELSEHMSISVATCTTLLRSLLQRGFIFIEESKQNAILHESYSLNPLWEKLYLFFENSYEKEKQDEQKEEEQSLYTIFEQEFGRPLSPFECESLAMWIDQDDYDPIIIKAALREAVISGKLNFRYIDRILFEWKKNGIRTIEQARTYSKKFRQNQSRPVKQNETDEKYERKVPFYNWLKN